MTGLKHLTPLERFYPFDKSIIKDCTILELQDKTTDLESFLESSYLSEDCSACSNVLHNRNSDIWNVENFRSLKIALMVLIKKYGLKKTIQEYDQLKKRELDWNSSQWSSALELCGFSVNDNRYHVVLAREVIRRWKNGERDSLFSTKDRIIERMMNYILFGDKLVVDNAEIATFAMMMGEYNIIDAEKQFPSLKYHESNRFESIPEALGQLMRRKTITSDDHRIVMGISLLCKRERWEQPNFLHREAIKKSFPRFWEMIQSE